MIFFVGAGLLAGALNYIFQLAASTRLPLLDFADFQGWLANLSGLFAIAAVLQYVANFWPAGKKFWRARLVAINLGVALCAGVWFTLPPGLSLPKGGLALVAASLFGWLSGQAQIRLHLKSLATAGVILGLFKIGFTFVPMATLIEAFAAAVVFSFIPATLFLSATLWSARPPPLNTNHVGSRWLAPLILSVVGSLLPQIDLIVLHRTQTTETFAQFALASLFYKGIYFVIAAYLQWLLPHQIRGEIKAKVAGASWSFAGLTILLAAGISALGPPLARAVLHWSDSPPRAWVFLACVNMGASTWIFARLQHACALGELRRATLIAMTLAGAALLQLALGLAPTNYLLLALGVDAALILGERHRP